MKTVLSRRTDVYTMTVPVRGGHAVNFQGGRATVPDDVAEILVAIGAGYYTLLAEGLIFGTGSRILVIRDMGLGDVLLITPLLRLLAARGCSVDVQTRPEYIPLFHGNAHVRHALRLLTDTPAASDYDAVLDLRQFVENEEAYGSRRHRVDGFASGAEIAVSPEEHHLDFFLTDAEAAAGRDRVAVLQDGGKCPTVAYVCRASALNRSWSAMQHEMVIDALLAAGWGVVLLDQMLQEPASDKLRLLNLTGQLTIRETAAVMAACRVVLTPDTGLFHLAGALNLPTVAYFGAFPAEERHTHTALTVLDNRAGCARFPCRTYNCFNRDDAGQSHCLAVNPADVVASLEKAVEAHKRVHSEVPE